MKFRILPFVWLTFSGGGVIAAVFLPILVILLAFALPLGWVDPSHAHLEGVVESWFTRLALFALIVPMLVHAAHRFRYTVYDGLQVKHKGLVALACYGGAMALSLVAFYVLGTVVGVPTHSTWAESGSTISDEVSTATNAEAGMVFSSSTSLEGQLRFCSPWKYHAEPLSARTRP